MDAALKSEIQEIIELVKTLPETLQLRAFEILLQDALDHAEKKPREQRKDKPAADPDRETEERERERRSEGLDPNTLPMRVKAFMKKTQITAAQIEKLFHIEGKELVPIWTLEATTLAKAQVRIALMQALKRALTSGEFSFDREEVREECKAKKSDAGKNFNANFNNSAKYFSGLDKEGLVSLTDEGMAALAALINQLAGANGTSNGK